MDSWVRRKGRGRGAVETGDECGVAVLRAKKKKMGSPGLRENPDMEGASASVESDDGDGVMGFGGDGFAACVEEDDERE
ncbi:hypothetical protein MRB53_016537 [Persea americana]|uniref:Uncharacterized protein n=1 Tax=Persea americana TaxID=3435 RepID=A0ACC2M350_PERAE|nr:hypothetical protein MRB53_016537 [Persea americana]